VSEEKKDATENFQATTQVELENQPKISPETSTCSSSSKRLYELKEINRKNIEIIIYITQDQRFNCVFQGHCYHSTRF
jgi:hypothetical protein